ncbi:MAG: GSCFA domain-containing protein [Cryomorphaceae bacterium]
MDKFRTEVNAPEFPFFIGHESQVMMLGSCFTENIGTRLLQNKIPTEVNPFGILFNPFSIMNSLERMLNDREYQKDELVRSGDDWVSLDHHGRFNNADPQISLESINASLNQGREKLTKADVIFITLGSAWVYTHRDTDHISANCHKIPNKAFSKRLLSFQEVHLILRHIPAFLQSKGIDAKVVFTVSPVRHWKDGAVENQRSKAHLIAAVHAVVEEFERCHYFPAYEMMMDDLRDYRFYGPDMLHPSTQAIDYVWQQFQSSFFSDETRIIGQELNAIVQAVQHRPMDPESNSFQRFLKKQIDIIRALEVKYPNVDLSKEKEHFKGYQL